MGLITAASGVPVGAVGGEEELGLGGWMMHVSPGRASGEMAPFLGSPPRMQIGTELRRFHTCGAKDLGRSLSLCVLGCSRPVGEAPAFPLPCCLFHLFALPLGDPKSPLQSTQGVNRHQDEGHEPPLGSCQGKVWRSFLS